MRAENEGMQKSTQSGLPQDWDKSAQSLGQVWLSVLCALPYGIRPSGDMCKKAPKMEKSKGRKNGSLFAVCPGFLVLGAKSRITSPFTKSGSRLAQVCLKFGGGLGQVWVIVPCARPCVSHSRAEWSQKVLKKEKSKGKIQSCPVFPC